MSELQPTNADPAGEYVVPEQIAGAIAGLFNASSVPAGGYMVPGRFAAVIAELCSADAAPEKEYMVPAVKSRQMETGAMLGSGQTVIIRGGVEKRVEAIVVAAGSGVKSGTGDQNVEVRHQINRVQTIVFMTPKIVTNEAAAKANTKR